MASERIEKLLAMQQKAEAQKRKAEQQLKAAKQPHPVRAHLYASSMRRAFSEGPCGVLDAFGINRGKPLRRLHRLPHDGALRQETEVNPCPARRGALRSSAAEKVNPAWLPAHIIQAKRSIPNTSAAGNIRTAAHRA